MPRRVWPNARPTSRPRRRKTRSGSGADAPDLPVGVKRTRRPSPGSALPPASSRKECQTDRRHRRTAPARVRGFPHHVAPHDIALKLAGPRDGAQTAAMLITMRPSTKDSMPRHPDYGPESRGGTSYADVHVSRGGSASPPPPTPTSSWRSMPRVWTSSAPSEAGGHDLV